MCSGLAVSAGWLWTKVSEENSLIMVPFPTQPVGSVLEGLYWRQIVKHPFAPVYYFRFMPYTMHCSILQSDCQMILVIYFFILFNNSSENIMYSKAGVISMSSFSYFILSIVNYNMYCIMYWNYSNV